MELFQVGGSVRDEILGLPSKDIDFTVVLNDADKRLLHNGTGAGSDTSFSIMVFQLQQMGFKIFLESPEFLTVRAQFPPKEKRIAGNDALDKFSFANPRLTADFVLARKESDYTDGRRPDKVEPGMLFDDLARRDFTVNAIAKDSRGNLIDPHNGVQDLEKRVLRAVGKPLDRLNEDALRAVRALRFSVTKGLTIAGDLRWAMEVESVLDALRTKISDERIQQEISKMVRHDPVASIRKFNEFPALTRVVFSGRVNLDATLKQRGFNK